MSERLEDVPVQPCAFCGSLPDLIAKGNIDNRLPCPMRFSFGYSCSSERCVAYEKPEQVECKYGWRSRALRAWSNRQTSYASVIRRWEAMKAVNDQMNPNRTASGHSIKE